MHASASRKEDSSVDPTAELIAAAESALKFFAPMWGLANFVAVNPFWGVRDKHISCAHEQMLRLSGNRVLCSWDYYREQNRERTFGNDELKEAYKFATEAALPPDFPALDRVMTAIRLGLDEADSDPQEIRSARTLSEIVDAFSGTEWSRILHEEITRFLPLYFDRGQAIWRFPLQQTDLFSAWKACASTDRNLELKGAKNARIFFNNLSADPIKVIGDFVRQITGDLDLFGRIATTELSRVRGWIAYSQHLAFEAQKKGEREDAPLHMLAIVCAYTLLLKENLECTDSIQQLQGEARASSGESTITPDTAALLILQSALEKRARDCILDKICPVPTSGPGSRPELQAVFCIDVRSEGYRLALETQSEAVQTYGFAGFFGLLLSLKPRGSNTRVSQYPVLLNSQFDVDELRAPEENSYQSSMFESLRVGKFLVKALRQSISSGFSFVEAFGALYSLSMLARVLPKLGYSTPERKAPACCLKVDLSLDQKISAGAAMLKNMGLKIPYAPVVLLCGHQAQTDNNPYQAALDCGACGGHGGKSNALVAAQILNDPKVRQGLISMGYTVLGDTLFLAAIHNTTTDDLTILSDLEALPESIRQKITTWISAAGVLARANRAPSLLANQQARVSPRDEVSRRAQDWSEVRPEWALARNTYFIAARRDRTRLQALNNRAFLHEYDSERDSDGSILELIMTAPMVVASWINLQYFGSSADQNTLGSGTKVLHNVTGQLGVVAGNGGDIQVGLPFQSVHSGKGLFHQPLRLQVLIEAPIERISSIVKSHQLLKETIENGWIDLFSLSRESSEFTRVILGEKGKGISLT